MTFREPGRRAQTPEKAPKANLGAQARSARGVMRILISGSSGLVGSSLVSFLESGGHQVYRLTRRKPTCPQEIEFDSDRGAARPDELEGFDAVIHLAGEPIAQGRWTEAKKALIRDSRVLLTRRLAESLGGLRRRPSVFISASAVGYYGDRGDHLLRESDGPGEGFLPEVCVLWEGASEPASRAGIRVVQLRTGLVLSDSGGALQTMLLPFSLGLGGRLGDGRQWWSFIAIDDLLLLIHYLIVDDSLSGPVNATSPEPVTNAEFTKTLGRILNRPTLVPIPKFALKWALGAMAEPLLLASARVYPQKLLASHFEYSYSGLEPALRRILDRL